MNQLLGHWQVESLEQLAATFGINWIWYNEVERSGHMKGLPPLISLALMTCMTEPELHGVTDKSWHGFGASGSARVAARAM